MPRQLRVESDEATYLMMNCGDQREPIFMGDMNRINNYIKA